MGIDAESNKPAQPVEKPRRIAWTPLCFSLAGLHLLGYFLVYKRPGSFTLILWKMVTDLDPIVAWALLAIGLGWQLWTRRPQDGPRIGAGLALAAVLITVLFATNYPSSHDFRTVRISVST